MREIKVRYRIQSIENNIITIFIKTLDQIELGHMFDWLFDPHEEEIRKVLSRDLYTGLKDNNGKELYEGDIVKFTTINNSLKEIEDIAFIDWCTWSCALFKLYKNERNYFTVFDKICASKCEVIGNIHQNPELLTS